MITECDGRSRDWRHRIGRREIQEGSKEKGTTGEGPELDGIKVGHSDVWKTAFLFLPAIRDTVVCLLGLQVGEKDSRGGLGFPGPKRGQSEAP